MNIASNITDRRLPKRVLAPVQCRHPTMVSSVGFRQDLSSSKWTHQTDGGRHALISTSRTNELFVDAVDDLSGNCCLGRAVPFLEKNSFLTSRNVFSSCTGTGGTFSTTASVLSRSSNAGVLFDVSAERVVLEFSSKRSCHLIEEISLCTLGSEGTVLAVGASNGTVVLFDTRQGGTPFREFVALESQVVHKGQRGKPSRADDAVVSVIGDNQLLWCAGSSGRMSLVDLRKEPSLKRSDNKRSTIATAAVVCSQQNIGNLTSVDTAAQFHCSHSRSFLFTTSLGSTCLIAVQELLGSSSVEASFSPPTLSFPDKWLRSEVCGECDSRRLTSFTVGRRDTAHTLVVDHYPTSDNSHSVMECREVRHITSTRDVPTDHPSFCMFAVDEGDSLQTWKLPS